MIRGQSRRASFIESVVNVVVGVGIAFVSNIAILSFLGIRVSLGDNLIMTLFFTGISLVRSFLLRRLFEMLRLRGLLPIALFTVLAWDGIIATPGQAPTTCDAHGWPLAWPCPPKPKDNNGCKPGECFDEHRGCFVCQ